MKAIPLKFIFAICTATLSAVLLISPLQAQGKIGEKPVIAVLDVQKIMRDAKAAKAIRKEVDVRRKMIEMQISGERKKLKADEQKLRQQRAILAPDAISQKQRELERRFGDLRRKAEKAGGGFNRAVSIAMVQLRQGMAKGITQVMKDKGINITLARAAVLVFDENLNITSAVLARLDKNLPHIKVDFDSAASKPAQKKR